MKIIIYTLFATLMSSICANAQVLRSIMKTAQKAAVKEAIEAGVRETERTAIKSAEKAAVRDAERAAIKKTEEAAAYDAGRVIMKDAANTAIKQVKTFDAYVGKKYAHGINGKKVMTLGESHYCGNPKQAIPSFTKDRIAEYKKYLEGKISIRDDNGWMQTYNNWLNTMAGRNLSKAEKLELIDKVSFYNYVQVPMKGPRVRPTAIDWKCSSDAFIQELKTQKPDVVFAWGEELYKNLPKTMGKKGKDIVLSNGKKLETWVYTIDGHSTTVVRTNHPASIGYNARLWNEVFTHTLK